MAAPPAKLSEFFLRIPQMGVGRRREVGQRTPALDRDECRGGSAAASVKPDRSVGAAVDKSDEGWR